MSVGLGRHRNCPAIGRFLTFWRQFNRMIISKGLIIDFYSFLCVLQEFYPMLMVAWQHRVYVCGCGLFVCVHVRACVLWEDKQINKMCHCLCVCSPDYDVNFFKQFTMVMNALDNRGQSVAVSVLTFKASFISKIIFMLQGLQSWQKCLVHMGIMIWWLADFRFFAITFWQQKISF